MSAVPEWFITAPGRAAGDAPRIFCFPHAGGSPRLFLDWQARLGGEAEIVAVCRPGREHRAAEPAPDLESFINGAAGAIRSAVADGRPFCLLGHSLGALVAFEVCRRLAGPGGARQLGGAAGPRHLIASGCAAPSLLPSARVREIATLTGADFAEAVGFFGGLDPAVIGDAELRDLLLPGVIADFRMAVGYRYQPGPPLAVPATLIVGRDDPHVREEQLAPWDREFTWPPQRHWVDGGHFYFDPDPGAVTGIVASLVRQDEHVELI